MLEKGTKCAPHTNGVTGRSRRRRGAPFTLLAAVVAAACASGAPPAERADLAPVADDERRMSEALSVPAEYRPRPISAEAGREYFETYGVGDPYGAGIPYPLFLALMREFPDRLGRNWREFSARFGTIPSPKSPEDPRALPVGFHLTTDPLSGTPFLMMSCQVCHAGRIVLDEGTEVVSGLGNTRLRIHDYDLALTEIALSDRFDAESLLPAAVAEARSANLRWRVDVRAAVVRQAVRKMRERAEVRAAGVRRLAGGLPGRVAPVEAFVNELNRRGASLDYPKTTGWVTIPDVAPFRHRATNSFDAATIGSKLALVAEADFAFGVRHEWYAKHPHIPTSMLLYLESFERELPYPGEIDRARAGRGKQLFDAECAGCHGSYSDERTGRAWVSYVEQVVAREIVGTDPARLDAVTPEFVATVNALSETRGLLHTRRSGGYVPRPLIGVWARAPYGHNGQWPDLAALATPAAERPRRFVVELEARYDLERVGLSWRELRAGEEAPAPSPARYLYDASRPGFSVEGHPFLSELAAADRSAVIEYLKTL
jgi:hypothetical protein